MSTEPTSFIPAPSDPASILATPPSTAGPAPSGGSAAGKKKKPVLTLVLGAVVVAGIGFGAGLWTGRATAPESTFDGSNFAGGNFGGGNMPTGGARPGQTESDGAGTGSGDAAGGFDVSDLGGYTQGTVTAADGDNLTITTDDGETVTVVTSGDTSITVDGSVADLAVGDTVTVMGTAADDGSITATTITEGSSLFGRGGGGFMPGGTGDGTMPSSFPEQ
ncbi:MAG: DUF5666 domain-containing protein [Bifidobacteriaceae bacterium]|jgi:hypothetical protein|nr:DUF5666 domain-containing protein [Bifidobacteriaceae bacterium]